MTSTASRSRKRKTASFAVVGALAVAAVALGAGPSRAQASEAAATAAVSTPEAAVARTPNPFADRFPNVVLKTHEGRNVRFYDDLLKGKIVLINFMYATCTDR